MNTTLGTQHEAVADLAHAPAEITPARVDPYRLAAVVIGVVGAILAFVLIRFTVDDSFISWRYGLSLMHGVWNWNASPQHRVEAYSNPLYTALSAVPALTGVPMELFFKLVGVGLTVGYLLVVRRLPVPRLQRLVLAACALMNPVFFVHAFSGLETASFALLLALLFGRLYVRGQLGTRGHLLALAVAFSRPEGMLFALVAEAWCLHLNRRRQDVFALAGMTLTLTVYWLARASYFHSFFPNPYLFKSASSMSDPNTLAHAVFGLVGMIAVLAGLGLGLELLRRLRGRGRKLSSRAGSPWRDATPAVLAGTGALLIMVLYRVSSLQMDYANRFRWQLLFPVALVLLARPLYSEDDGAAGPTTPRNAASPRWIAATVLVTAVTAVTGAAPYATNPTGIAIAGFAACLAAAAVWIFASRPPVLLAVPALVAAVSMTSATEIMDWSVYRYHLGGAHEQVALALAADPSLTGVIAVEDAGMLAYHLRPDQRALDLSGLADPFYAHPPVPAAVTGKLVAIVAGSDRPDGTDVWWGDDSSPAVFHTAAAEHFSQIASVMYAPGYWLKVFAAPGHGRAAAAALAPATTASSQQNGESNATLLGQHLFDFPFLHD